MKDQTVIEIKNLSKTFRIYENPKSTIRDYILQFSSRGKHHIIKAVYGVDMKVKSGEFIGIIGKNGSGKSTLLRMIIGAIKADKGSIIHTKGRILRLALGMGFDPNLSARDNIYLNGSIIGLSFKRIGKLFHQMINFAELEEFVDTPIKYFSSGMVSRLAFSIAIHADADILLIDEFFGGVGDQNFQKKSSEAFDQFISDDKTILLVSHDLEGLRARVDKIGYMKKGRLVKFGPPDETIDYYLQDLKKEHE